MPRAQERACLSKAETIDLPVGAGAAIGASTMFFRELNDKVSIISVLVERECAGTIAYADELSRAQGLISGITYSAEDAATMWLAARRQCRLISVPLGLTIGGEPTAMFGLLQG